MANNEIYGFGWFSKNQKAIIIRKIGEDGQLEETGIVLFTRDLELLREGKLTKRDGTLARSFKVLVETPYEKPSQ